MRTFADLIDRLRTYVGNDGSAQKSSAVIRAANEAVQAIGSRTDWNYFSTNGRISTSASYATGTIAIDVTGSTYERQVTLTGGVWPDWAAYGTVVINAVPYDVDRRISDTVLTLRLYNSPGSDVAAGTSYNLQRQRYPLPANFVSMKKPGISAQSFVIPFVTLNEFNLRRQFADGPGQPSMFTIDADPYGMRELLLWPAPDQTYPVAFWYRRKPIIPVVVEEQTGKISLTAASTAVTGISTNFTAAMVDAVLRVSYDQTPPTAPDSVAPPQYEYLIDSYTSTTLLTLRDAASASVTGRAYTISSRLDVAEGEMFSYLVAMAEKRLRISLRMNMQPGEEEEYMRIMAEAKGADGQWYAGPDVAGVRNVSRDPMFVHRPGEL